MLAALRNHMAQHLPTDPDLRFRANLLLSILLTINILSLSVILYFSLIADLQMDGVTRRWALLLIGTTELFYAILTASLLRGHYRLASLGTIAAVLGSVVAAVLLTAGIPTSPAIPMLLLPAVVALCLLNGRAGRLIAVLIPVAGAAQWYLSAYWGLQLPARQSQKNPAIDILFINGVNYYLVIVVLLVYERINHNLRRELDTERQRLAHFATHDDLTGLANRRYFLQRLNEACARSERSGQQIAVLYIDLDGFKQINDSLGHAAGDSTLSQIAQRLTAMLRRQDLVARLGGDEFAIIIDPCGSQHEITELCARLQHTIAEPLLFGAQQFSVGASIGVALYPSEGIDIDHVLRLADVAMYAAKHSQKKAAALSTDR